MNVVIDTNILVNAFVSGGNCSEKQAPIYSCSLRKQSSPLFQSHVESRDINWGFDLFEHV